MKNAHNNFIKHLSDEELRQAFFKRFQATKGEIIISSEQAFQHLSGLVTDMGREKFAVIYLNGANALISSEVIFEGSLTTSAVYPRELIRKILEKNAAAIIIGHNHPSGSVCPSQMDKEITQRIKQACSAVDVTLHDHIIIGYDKWFSFSDDCMLDVHPKFETRRKTNRQRNL